MVCLSKTLNAYCLSSYDMLRKAIFEMSELERKEIESQLEEYEKEREKSNGKDSSKAKKNHLSAQTVSLVYFYHDKIKSDKTSILLLFK